MTDKRISELTRVSSPDGTEIIPAVTGDINKSTVGITAEAFATYAASLVDLNDIPDINTYLLVTDAAITYSTLGHTHTKSEITDLGDLGQIDTLAEASDYNLLLTEAEATSNYSPVGHTHTLGELSNVDLTAEADNYVLTYNSSTSNYEPKSVAGGITLDALSNVNFTSLSDEDIVIYDGSANEFVNTPKGTLGITQIQDGTDVTDTLETGATLIWDGTNFESKDIDLKIFNSAGGDMLQLVHTGATSGVEANPFLEFHYAASPSSSPTRIGYLGFTATSNDDLTLYGVGDINLRANGTGYIRHYGEAQFIQGAFTYNVAGGSKGTGTLNAGELFEEGVSISDIYAPIVHTHLLSDASDYALLATVVDSDNNYAPIVHNHTLSEITDSGDLASLNTLSQASDYNSLLTEAEATSNYAPLSHNHTLSEITDSGNLAPLDTLAEASDYNLLLTEAEAVTNYSAKVHTHTLSDVTDSGDLAGLDTLSQASDYSSLLTESEATFNYAPISHTHVVADITDRPYLTVGNVINASTELDFSSEDIKARGVGDMTFTRSTTGTYLSKDGYIKTAGIDQPRIEKDGILLESAGTNYLFPSLPNGTGSTDWVKSSSMVVTPNAGIGLDGITNDAVKVEDVNDGESSILHITSTLASTLDKYQTIFLKKGVGQYCQVELRRYSTGPTDTQSYYFDFDNLTATPSAGLGIVDITQLADGWVRIIAFYNESETSTSVRTLIRPVTASNTTDNSLTGHIFIGGVQISTEPASYIPTTTTTATRTVDVLQFTKAGNIPDLTTTKDEMSILVDFTMSPRASSSSLSGYLWGRYVNSSSYFRAYFAGGAFRFNHQHTGYTANQISGTAPSEPLDTHRFGLVITKDHALRIYLNGEFQGEDLDSLDTPLADAISDYFCIGSYNSGGGGATTGNFKNFRVFDKALTDEEMRVA